MAIRQLEAGVFLLGVAALICTLACSERPVHYPEIGSKWTLPMVDPMLAAGVVVPATIHGKGPFLFLLDPDAVTSIDAGVAAEVGLFSRPDSWRQYVTMNDRMIPRRPFEILRWQSGNLGLSNFVALSLPAGSLEVGGRRIHGILGGELLTRTIVIDLDRDRGVVELTSSGRFEMPLPAARLSGRALRNPSFATRGLAVPVTVDDLGDVELVVALAAPATAVQPRLFRHHGGAAVRPGRRWTDDSGDVAVAEAAKRGRIDLAKAISEPVLLDLFPDRRLWYRDFAGVLGQDVLSRFRVIYDRDRRDLWLRPRSADLAKGLDDRLRRWGKSFRECPRAECVDIEIDTDARQVAIRAGGGFDIDSVSLEAIDTNGHGLGMPISVVRLEGREQQVIALADEYFPNVAGFRVVDMSPTRAINRPRDI